MQNDRRLNNKQLPLTLFPRSNEIVYASILCEKEILVVFYVCKQDPLEIRRLNIEIGHLQNHQRLVVISYDALFFTLHESKSQ